MILDDLIAFENEFDVLNFRYEYKNILIWPMIRDYLYVKVTRRAKGAISNPSSEGKPEIRYMDMFKRNPFKIGKCDIIFMTSEGNWVKDGEKYVDRIHDGLIPPPIDNVKYAHILSDRKRDANPYIPENCFTDVFIQELIRLKKGSVKITEKERDRIDEFLQFLKMYFPVHLEQGTINWLREMAIGALIEIKLYYKYYGRLIKNAAPQIVINQCASYRPGLMKVFNDLGVVTAEFQHGHTGVGERAYQQAKKLSVNPEYREYFPKYFLSQGEFWCKDIDMASQVVPIGNPYKSRKISACKNVISEDDTIVIATANNHTAYIEFIDGLLSFTGDKFKIIVKLHPLNPESKKLYSCFAEYNNVIVSHEGNIYDYLSRAEYVVGDTSTSIYEAAAMGKKLYILDNEYTRCKTSPDVGVWIRNGKDFLDKMKEPYPEDKTIYFDENYVENYNNFMKKVLK